MKTFLSALSLGLIYIIFLAAESFTRHKLDNYFNQDYINQELDKFTPYLLSYLLILWIILTGSIIKILLQKEKNDNNFVVWILIFAIIAVPLTALVSPLFTVIF